MTKSQLESMGMLKGVFALNILGRRRTASFISPLLPLPSPFAASFQCQMEKVT